MSRPLYWKIDRDYQWDADIDDPESKRVGTCGPRGCDSNLPLVVRFRLVDDDGEVYYGGSAANGESLISALDDFGRPYAGCTEVQVRNSAGKWESYI